MQIGLQYFVALTHYKVFLVTSMLYLFKPTKSFAIYSQSNHLDYANLEKTKGRQTKHYAKV